MADRNSTSVERLRELLAYDPDTGILTWRVRVSNRHPGTVAGTSRNAKGYFKIKIDRRKFFVHRVIWCWMTGKWPVGIDHINRTRDDNRWLNLREATGTQNNGNTAKPSRNTSGFKGVHWDAEHKRWRAQMDRLKGGKREKVHLGRFKDPAEAHEAYKKAASAYFGEFFRPE